ncbi:LysR family transcriptional regulator [Mesorhizobium ciceri]|uniref:helix-turn-helix domain-containing protein n=2 Tax=Mesorhizobium ciceri TaxID=39645 RepID=UPI0030844834
MGRSHIRSLLCLSTVINAEKMNQLFSFWGTIRGTKMQNLEPILIFTTVAEMGSFTRAADSLGIQKGRASTAVRKLEEDVGVRLLHRTTRSVRLTEDGRDSCPRPRSAC